MTADKEMLDVPVTPETLQGFYGNVARVYDGATAKFEASAKAIALDAISRQPGETYLEVAVGTGMSIVEQVRRTGPKGIIGMDLTAGMLTLARERLDAEGAASVPLVRGDARQLPFPSASFDWVFNSYMLDLIPTAEIAAIVSEFRRVLKPGGRIVLANLTEGEGEDAAFMEDWKTRFLADPVQVGGCRPVLAASFLAAAGFEDVERTYCGGSGSWPTEVVTARVPGARPAGESPDSMLALLACPVCRGPIAASDGGASFGCKACSRSYPVAAGIPDMVVA